MQQEKSITPIPVPGFLVERNLSRGRKLPSLLCGYLEPVRLPMPLDAPAVYNDCVRSGMWKNHHMVLHSLSV